MLAVHEFGNIEKLFQNLGYSFTNCPKTRFCPKILHLEDDLGILSLFFLLLKIEHLISHINK